MSKIIEAEGPIHQEEVARRVSHLFGLRRTGSRIRNAVDGAVAAAVRKRIVRRDGNFLAASESEMRFVRDRSDVEFPQLRKPEMLPPEEVRCAVDVFIDANLGVNRDETIQGVARLLGFKSTSRRLKEMIEAELDALAECGTVSVRNEKYFHE